MVQREAAELELILSYLGSTGNRNGSLNTDGSFGFFFKAFSTKVAEKLECEAKSRKLWAQIATNGARGQDK